MLSNVQKLEATYYLFYILENFLEPADLFKAGETGDIQNQRICICMNYSLDYLPDGTAPYISFIPNDLGIWDAPFAGPVTCSSCFAVSQRTEHANFEFQGLCCKFSLCYSLDVWSLKHTVTFLSLWFPWINWGNVSLRRMILVFSVLVLTLHSTLAAIVLDNPIPIMVSALFLTNIVSRFPHQV